MRSAKLTAKGILGRVAASLASCANLLFCLTAINGTCHAQVVLPQNGIINTLAGNGTAGYTGDSGLATSAELNYPWGMAVDSSANIYISDSSNNVIRKVSASTGIITTVAGNGTAGYSGDGGSATSAELNGPAGIALDSAGNIYIADQGNNLIREVSAATGIISTVAGIPNNPWGGYWGDGGLATSAAMTDPAGVSVDANGNIYIADMFNNVIRKVTSSTGIITTIAGNGNGGYSGDGGAATSAELQWPADVQEDSAGNLYIADYYNNVVRKVSASAGIITTVAGNGTGGYSGDLGPATSATLGGPMNLALDSLGNIYISDSGNSVVRKVTSATGIITTIAGNYSDDYTGDGGLATAAALNWPMGLAIQPASNFYSAFNLYIVDSSNSVVRAVGAYRQAAPTFSPISATYSTPQSVTISDSLAGATIHYTSDGTSPTTASPVYSGPITVGSTETLNAVAVTSGGLLSAIGTAPYTITQVTPTANFSSGFTSTGMNLMGATISGGALQLSDTNINEERAAWFTTPVSSQAFTTDFNYQATSATADGITFVLQNSENGVNAVGADGEDLGYGNIDSSAAIKFDLYNNLGEGTDSTGFFSGGTSPILPALDMTSSGVILLSGDLMHVHVTYDGATLTWTISDTVTNANFTSSTAVNIPSLVGGNTAYVGFTGATGAFDSNQFVTGWTHISGPATTFAATPTFSPAGGTYGSAQTVSISDTTPGATIYYTTDGTTPSTSSTAYSTAISVNSSETLNAIAVATGYYNSADASATYAISSGVNVSVSPASLTLYGGQTQQFSATVSNTSNTAVTWTISPSSGAGSVSTGGLYTAPPSITTQQAVTITATSQADTTKSASATIALSPCPASGYSYQRAIVIDHTKVPNTDQVNFPFLFNTTDAAFKSTANGGHVTSASGYDIIFSTDPAGQSKLDHELEEYNAVTGQVIAWVRIPTLSHASDTVIYVFYGNSSISTSQQNPTGVWDANYMGVWHVANGSILSLADSTSNSDNATNNGATATAGQIDGGMQTDGSTYATIGTPANLANLAQGNATLSAWVNSAVGAGGTIMSKDATFGGWSLSLDSNNTVNFAVPLPDRGFLLTSSVPAGSGTWSYIVVSLAGNAYQGSATMYINGSPAASGFYYSNGDDSAQAAYFANDSSGNVATAMLTGSEDELRISNATRSGDWVAAEFANQGSPSTFYNLSSENATGVFPSAVSLYASQTQQFQIPASSACGTVAALTWGVSPSNAGTISSSGVYTAPISVASQQTVTVTATSQVGSETYNSATVTLLPPVSVGVAPATATLSNAYQQQQFTASVSNVSNAAVTWTIYPAGTGTIDATGLYTAPYSFDIPNQIVTIIATSVADNTKSATATLTLNPTVSININPAVANLFAGQTQTFYANVGNAFNAAVTWSISPANAGTIISYPDYSGLYVVPQAISVPQAVTVTATSVADTTKSASAIVTLIPPVIVTPSSSALYGGQTQQLNATVGGTITSTVNWTISPGGVGSISSSGLYTAPASIPVQQTVIVTATSQTNSTQFASAMIALSPTPCAAAGYNYERAVVIDHTKVPNTDQVNFPFLFNTTDAALKSTANGGHVSNSSGYDIIFSTDPAGQSKLDHELEEYNPVTGQVIAWVRIPTLSHTSDTVLYVFYGKSSITTSQQNPTGVWDANYMGVWHVANGSVLSLADSTSNGDNATNNGATATVGQIDGGMQTDGSTYATVGTPANLANLAQGNATFSAWVNSAVGTGGTIMGKESACSGWALAVTNTNDIGFTISPCDSHFSIGSPDPIPSGAWSYAVVTLDGNTGSDSSEGVQATLYVNGSPVASALGGPGLIGDDSGTTAYLANATFGKGPLDGSADEFRISNTIRSTDWIATEYNNQASPSTFYSLYSENAVNATPIAAFLHASQSQQFSASGLGTCGSAPPVTWTISPSNSGTISTSGLYVAPGSVPNQQTVTVTATPQAGDAIINSATVTLLPPMSISVSPANVTLSASNPTQQFTASVSNASSTAVTWTISPAGLGTIDSTGLYTAPGSIYFGNPQQTVTITATSQWDNTVSASATVTLIPGVWMTVTPGSATVSSGNQTLQFFASVFNTSNSAVTWSISGPGSISQTGFYTAPATIANGQTVGVTATSQSDPTSSATSVLTFVAPETVTPANATLYGGQTQQFAASNTYNPLPPTWSISPAGVGTISSTGLYTAPATITAQQAVIVTATSQGNTSISASAIITLAPGTATCASSGYGYQRAVVINHTKIPNTDQANFPFLFNTTDVAFKTTANGGHVASSSGYDIIFSTDPNGVTKLDHELEEYNPATGQIIAWVRIPTLSHTSDTALYVFYGNSSINTSQQNAPGVWDANFQAVYHLASAGSGLGADSTVNGNNGAVSSATPVGGEIAGGASFDGTTAFIQLPTAEFGTGASGTFDAWFKTSSYGVILGQTEGGETPGESSDFPLGIPALYVDSTGHLVASMFGEPPIVTSTVYNDNQWHLVAVTTGGAGLIGDTLYVDGHSQGSNPNGGAVAAYDSTYNYFLGTGAATSNLGVDYPGTNDWWFYYSGALDEVRTSKFPRSGDWVQAEYNNQSSPSTFYALNPERTEQVSPPAISLYASQSQQFTASIAGSCSSATSIWSMPSTAPGTLTQAGLYVAPATIETQQTVIITATTLGDNSRSSTVSVNLLPNVAISLTPLSATLTDNQTQQFTATVANSSITGVNWTIYPVDSGNIGSISATGLYTAPANMTAQQTVVVTATSQADPTQSASATITLTPTAFTPTPPPSGQCGSNGYGFQRVIVIDHTKVPHTDQTDFPFLFNTIDPDLATLTNGGHVTNSNGYDIIFSTDPNGLTKLDHEMEEYNPATGQVIAWVRIPTLSHTTDTVLYVFYGNPNVIGSQQNVSGVWDSDYQAVYHLANVGTSNAVDSTDNGNVAPFTSVSGATGKIDGAAGFDGATSYLQLPNSDFPNYPTGVYEDLGLPHPDTTTSFAATFGAWFKTATAGGILGQISNQDCNFAVFGICAGYGPVSPGFDPTRIRGWNGMLYVDDDGSVVGGGIVSATAYNDNNWHFASVTYATDGTDTLYVDGQNVGSSLGQIPVGYSPGYEYFVGTVDTRLGELGNWFWLYFDGQLDEVTVSDIPRSGDWIQTEYKNQSSPSSFYHLYPASTQQVVPSTTNLYASQAQQFAATGACNSAVLWTIPSGAPGTLSSSGVYVAPGTVTSQQTVTITATSQTSGATLGTAVVTLLPPPPPIALAAAAEPPYVTGTSQTFLATLNDQDGNAQAGVVVNFAVTGANANLGSATTNASGVASYVYTGANTGSDSIQATAVVDGQSLTSGSVPASWIAPTPPITAPVISLVAQPMVGLGGLVGAFTDNTGAVIEPLAIGAAPRTVVVPAGATQLQLGIDDNYFEDNGGSGFVVAVNGTSVSVPATSMPWNWITGGLNNSYQFGMKDGTSPVIAATGLTQGESIRIVYQGGTVSTSYPTRPLVNAAGDLSTITGVTIINGTPYSTMFTTASSYPLGQPITFSALVTDGPGTPLADVPVTLTITGANPGQYEATTDSTGTATFVYTGAYSGADFLLAQAVPSGGSTITSNQSTVAWAAYTVSSQPASLALSFYAALLNGQVYAVLATDASGNPILNAGVGYYVTGVDNFQESGITDVTGHASFDYNHSNAGGFSMVSATTVAGNVIFSNTITGNWVPGTTTNTCDCNDINVSITAQSSVTLPNTLSLTGTINDNVGITPTAAWTQISGPGTVTFADPTQATTTASFSESGTYVLQLTGSDTGISESVQLTVNVYPVPHQTTDQGWIGSPLYGATVTGLVPITLASGVNLQSGTLVYYPANNINNVTVLNANTTGSGQIGTFDTTMLANGSYWIQLQSTQTNGDSEYDLVLLTVAGNYKPGRVTAAVTDLVVPATGLAINIQRTYDSLNAATSSDFGFGWALGTTVNLTVDPQGDVTFTLGGQRRTFYLAPQAIGYPFGEFLAAFSPEPGFNGNLTGSSSGCSNDLDVLVPSGSVWFCAGGGQYSPPGYVYTDPSGTQYTISANGSLQSVVDRVGNALTITPAGIFSSTGLSVPFVRDSYGRITQITDPQGNQYLYTYDSNGNLSTVTYPNTTQPSTYAYAANHYYTGGTDARSNPLPVTTYFGPTDTDPNGLPLNGRLESVTNALSQTTSYAYNLATNTTTVTYPPDASGNVGTATMVYDSYGMLLTSTDPLGHTTTNVYDTNHNLTSVTDPLGHVNTYTYDSNGNKTSSTYPATATSTNTTSTTQYNQYSEPVSTTDELGNVRTFNYDANFNPQSVTDGIGTLASFLFNTNTTLAAGAIGFDIAATPANASQFTYDANGNLASRTDALGRTTSYTYNSLGQKLTMTTPLTTTGTGSSASTTTYTYDAIGNLTNTTAPLSRTTSSTYDANGNKLSDTDPRGNVTTYAYDALNRLTTTTYPTTPSTTSTKTYDFRNNVINETDQAGNVTHHVYDLAGRQTSVTRAYGTGVKGNFTYGYDNARNQISVTDANSHATQLQYDSRKRLTKRTFADSTYITYTYDGPGNQTSVTDQAGNVVHYTYDAANQLATVVQTNSPNTGHNTNSYGFDDLGNLTGLADANGHVTMNSFNLLSLITAKTLPDGSLTETRSYDAAGNLTSLTHFNGVTTTYTYDGLNRLLTRSTPGETTVSFTYTATGQYATSTDASGTTTYSYDSMDRLVTKATPEGTLNYTFDAAGHVATIASSNTNGASVSYTYDDLNRLATVVDNRLPSGSNTTTYAYDPASNLATATYPNGLQSTFTYDSLNRVTALDTPVSGYAYQFDPTGKRTMAVELSGRTLNWSYDGINRLTQETIADAPGSHNGTVAYSLDPVGNRLSNTSSLSGVSSGTFGYNADDEVSTETYDANGNTLTTGGKTFAYDSENHLTSMNGGAVSIVYDAFGKRVSKTVGGVTTKYLVEDDVNPTGYPQVMEEIVGGTVQRTYTYGLQRISQDQLISGTWTPSFYGYDGAGTVRQLTNASGAITDSYDYDAFGNVANQTGSTPNNYLYRAEQYDSDLGLYYLRARYYNPLTGRFVSRDPLDGKAVDPKTLHKYLYGDGDPINYSDPTGQSGVRTASGGALAEWTGVVVLIAIQTVPAVRSFEAAVVCELNKDAELLSGLVWDPGAKIESITFGPCSAKVKKRRSRDCMKRYLEEKAYCLQYIDFPRYPGGRNLYAECMATAQGRFEACVDGLPDPEPLDPLQKVPDEPVEPEPGEPQTE